MILRKESNVYMLNDDLQNKPFCTYIIGGKVETLLVSTNQSKLNSSPQSFKGNEWENVFTTWVPCNWFKILPGNSMQSTVKCIDVDIEKVCMLVRVSYYSFPLVLIFVFAKNWLYNKIHNFSELLRTFLIQRIFTYRFRIYIN